MNTQELVGYLNKFLEIDKIPDASLNGLQVQGHNLTTKVGAAVDVCLDSVRAAAKAGVDFLIVHHGLFWGKEERLVGSHYERIKSLVDADINLYCAHLPLDWHPQVGNNAVLVREIGFEPVAGFGPSGAADGRAIGCIALAPEEIDRATLIERLCTALGTEIRSDCFGPNTIKRLAVVTGGGASLIPLALHEKIDAFITGEPKHSYFHYCKENGITVLYGGHYQTETFGVIAMAKHLQAKFHLPFEFFDFPTGL